LGDFHKVKILYDSLIAINFLKDEYSISHPHRTLVEKIHEVHHQSDLVEWQHVLREVNQVADLLAKHELTLNVDLNIFNFVRSFVSLPSLDNSNCRLARGGCYISAGFRSVVLRLKLNFSFG
jgi:hypothetical protein